MQIYRKKSFEDFYFPWIFFTLSRYIVATLSNNPKEDYREKKSKNITYEFGNQEYTSPSKDGLKGVFSRERKLSFVNLILFLIRVRGALQRELDEFYKSLYRRDLKIREISKSALSPARAKLNEWAFIRLNEVAATTLYENAAYHVWNGMRTLVVDGARLVLPNHTSYTEKTV